MKSEHIKSEAQEEEVKYPCLMKSKLTGAIYLMSEPGKGMRVVRGSGDPIGGPVELVKKHLTFLPKGDKVILQND